MNSHNREIDIFELYRIVADFFRRRFVVFLIISVLGLAFGFVKVKMQNESYQAKIIVRSHFVSKEDLSSKVLLLIENDNLGKDDLALLFNAKESVFKSVNTIMVDTVSLKNALVLKLNLNDTVCLNEIAKSIDYFYNGFSDLKARFSTLKVQNQNYAEVLESEIDKILAFQDKVLADDNSNQSILLTDFSGSSEELFRLLEKQYEIEQKIHSENPVTVVFSSVLKSKSASLTNSLILWFFVFNVLGLLILFFVELDRGAKKRA